MKANRNFYIKHILAVPEKILSQVKVSQIQDELEIKRMLKDSDYENALEEAKKRIDFLLSTKAAEVSIK